MSMYLKYIVILTVIACFMACSKMEDSYNEFTKGGEIIYTGRVDSLKVSPGKNRIRLSWQLISDPAITKCKVFWNDRADSMLIPVQRSTGVDTITVMLNNMAEKTYTFDIYTYDNAGHSSVSVDTLGIVYGDNYAASLFNRPLKTIAFSADTARLDWSGASAQCVGVQLRYNDVLGVLRTAWITSADKQTKLPAFKKGNNFEYRTLYLPAKAAIDTFYTAFESKLVP